ncbi:MAG: hypothetical protein MJA84_09245 [Firmicutes bacterium]|nr:hypothetical protein [Bacillota bacterium]
MPNNQNMSVNPLITLMLLMAASTPDPSGRLNDLGRAITSMQDAIKSINTGLEAFHTQVLPMFQRDPNNISR